MKKPPISAIKALLCVHGLYPSILIRFYERKTCRFVALQLVQLSRDPGGVSTIIWTHLEGRSAVPLIARKFVP